MRSSNLCILPLLLAHITFEFSLLLLFCNHLMDRIIASSFYVFIGYLYTTRVGDVSIFTRVPAVQARDNDILSFSWVLYSAHLHMLCEPKQELSRIILFSPSRIYVPYISYILRVINNAFSFKI